MFSYNYQRAAWTRIIGYRGNFRIEVNLTPVPIYGTWKTQVEPIVLRKTSLSTQGQHEKVFPAEGLPQVVKNIIIDFLGEEKAMFLLYTDLWPEIGKLLPSNLEELGEITLAELQGNGHAERY